MIDFLVHILPENKGSPLYYKNIPGALGAVALAQLGKCEKWVNAWGDIPILEISHYSG